MKATFPILAAAAVLCFSSCASTDGATTAKAPAKKQGGSKLSPDHEPKIDFWQNGGGACCAYHAQAALAES